MLQNEHASLRTDLAFASYVAKSTENNHFITIPPSKASLFCHQQGDTNKMSKF
jgi:hypothetical protein